MTIADGTTGGPLLNLSGQVVGLSTMAVGSVQNGNFVPISLAQKAISVINEK